MVVKKKVTTKKRAASKKRVRAAVPALEATNKVYGDALKAQVAAQKNTDRADAVLAKAQAAAAKAKTPAAKAKVADTLASAKTAVTLAATETKKADRRVATLAKFQARYEVAAAKRFTRELAKASKAIEKTLTVKRKAPKPRKPKAVVAAS